MQFIHSTDGAEGVEAMAGKVTEGLKSGEVLWLVCGGSSIPLAVRAMRLVRESAGEAELAKLIVGLTDERYGAVGHTDSNWQQLIDAGFEFSGVATLPVLSDLPLDETVVSYTQKLGEIFARKPLVVAQFGIGADGHVAGILPHTPSVEATEFVASYDATPYTRITITPPAFAHISAAYTFAFGGSKANVIPKLRDTDQPIIDMPSQLLKQIPESYLYSDQV